MTDIKEKIEQERENAHQVCSTEGATSAECAVAWDTVEELQAEAAHQEANTVKKTDFEKYCDENPDADECRLYED
ncbi:MAG: hypothetical protein F6K09_18810 [Merismopedia sp. SIO2A8]|nr:hypothetical protein [Merismopedia sp. SIO2A8]